YLDKNHAFRHKLIEPKMQALVTDNSWVLPISDRFKEIFAISGWRNFAALLNFQNIKAGDFFQDSKSDSYIWSYACGGGRFDSCKYIGSTNTFVNQSPKTVFTAFYGSRFGDWDSENNFMRAALASKGWILTTCWAGRPHYTFHQMGMGETIGYCVRATQNNMYNYYCGATQTKRGIHISLLGDPTLRMHIVRPLEGLKATIMNSSANANNQSIVLSWDGTDDSIVEYYIYKLDTLTNNYIKIANSPAMETRFEDKNPEGGNNYYMVRVRKLSRVVSGSFYNLSQGIFDTIHFETKLNEKYMTENKISYPPAPEITVEENTLRSNALSGNQWYYNDKIIPGATESTYTPELNGNYYVKVTLNNSYSGFSNTIPFVFTGYDEPNVIIKPVIYPNPSNGIFNISFSSSVQQVILKIYNLKGKLLYSNNYSNTSLESFDIGTFPKGIYLARVFYDESNLVTKIIVQ
ncbi:MAG TPA: T9SS type A sorting domain-containing protein, partial [Draconibacterium sp.]|nr:T9SS type A sorting domain-containing protein [Draconibacterium sp.]